MTLLDVAGWLDELAVVCDANRAVLGDGTVADEYTKESRRFKAAAAACRESAGWRKKHLDGRSSDEIAAAGFFDWMTTDTALKEIP